MKKLLAAAAASLLLAVTCTMPMQQASADEQTPQENVICISDEGSNLHLHDYGSYYARKTGSHLVPLEDGNWLRLQLVWTGTESIVVAERYTPDFQRIWRKVIGQQLPEYGGFHAGRDGYYYLVTGDEQDSLDEHKPMIDIAKYNADWELVGHVQTEGDDIVQAFRAGTVRCADDGRFLIVHTSRRIASGHQTNYTLEVDTESMEITEERSRMTLSSGYASHSFNQFVLLDGNNVVTLDHGDFFPRCVMLAKYASDLTTGTFTSYYDMEIVNMASYGALGDVDTQNMSIMNYTGVFIGGFEQSSTHYLTAYSTIDQSLWYDIVTGQAPYGKNSVRNIMISAVPKDDLQNEAVIKIPITDYTQEEGSPGTPFLVPAGEDRFLLMWQHGRQICYEFLDGAGNVVGEQYTMDGTLSDCEPVFCNNKVYWYTWDDADVSFYSIDTEHPEQTETVLSVSGHDYQAEGEPDEEGYVYEVCTKCGDRIRSIAPTSFVMNVFLIEHYSDSAGYSASAFHPESTVLEAKDLFMFDRVRVYPDEYVYQDEKFHAEITDGSEYVRYDPETKMYTVSDFDEAQISFTIKCWLRENPALFKEYTFRAAHHYELTETVLPDGEQEGWFTFHCTDCGHTYKKIIAPFTVLNGETAKAELETDTFEYDHAAHEPAVSLLLTDAESAEQTALEQGKDFTVQYIDNVNAGTAYALLTAADDSTAISGTMILPFTINPQQLQDCIVIFRPSTLDPEAPETDLVSALTPTVRIFDKQGFQMPEGSFYTRGMYQFTEDGLHLDSIAYNFHAQHRNYGNSTNETYKIPLISIEPYTAAFADEALAESGIAAYTGEAVEPEITLTTAKGRALKSGEDYSVTYENNTECGTATAVITGLMCYTGEIRLEFTIKGAEIHPAPASGDPDGDGKITVEDTALLNSWIFGKPDAALTEWQAADMNQDQVIDAADLTMMKRAMLAQKAQAH